MNLVVFTHKLFRLTERGYETDGALTLQLDALAPYFDTVFLSVPVKEDRSFQGVALQADNVTFLPLPAFQGREDFLRKTPDLVRRTHLAMRSDSVGLVILPGYYSALASWLCQRQGFPIFQWVVGDWRQNVRSHRQGSLQQPWTSLWSLSLESLMKRLTRNELTFFNGRVLYSPSPPYHHTRLSSSIQLKHLYQRENVRTAPPYQLLYVGRLSPEKGLPDLLQVLAILRKDDVCLHIVGAGEQKQQLKEMASTMGIDQSVVFHGFVPQGPELRKLYRNSDLFILPSHQDQQPKVLMEAMGQGVPVIATRVGGIPSIVQDGQNGRLVPSAQPQALAITIRTLLADAQQRRLFVQKGFQFVKDHSVDVETAKMMRQIIAHFGWQVGD